MREKTCHDCGAREGQIHQLGCDMERCPWCGGQLITCSCVYRKLKIDCRPGTWAYENGLTDEQTDEWEKLLEKEGRIPYIQWPIVCAYCGVLWPELFMAPDEEWKKYIDPRHQEDVVCRKCYDYIKDTINKENHNGKRRRT